ncbi:cytochrome P450 CYP736A12-like [Neltuma alba]|uniref:cytochrome P450 CYP736A12-like n=1 Tax=Neltuma alba TaxID=207710 RepID=UPI0010A488C7|nr:cytochrome P450 CYP736A12-like [Prosopis alba]
MLPSSSLPFPSLLLLPLLFLLSALFLSLCLRRTKHGLKQPPGPPAWPVIGNLHQLGTLPHRSLQSLAKRYGPIMSLRLGQVPAVVVSSPEAAELFLRTHDVVFASRPRTQASEFLSYGSKGMVFSEYGPYWRDMRKLCTLQLVSSSKLETFAPLRREELGQLVKSIEKSAAASEVVDLTGKVERLVEDIMYKMIFGRNRDDRFGLKGLIHEALNLVGAFNIADFVPFLAPFDIQGLTRKLKRNYKALEDVLDKIVMEHENTSKGQNLQHHNDFIHILLSLMHQPVDLQDDQDHVIDKANIKAILSDMVGGATDTSIVVIEWALSELLRHPRVMKNLQNELQNVVGMTRMVEESDLAKLSYLDMVIKETLRLYPVAPLLVPRESMEDVTINGCYIRKKTRVIVNVWAIGRDSKVWSENAHMFHPERFVDSNIDVRGHDFQLLPFGSGRRGCPGMNLGMTSVKFVLAQLVHCFSWELPYGMSSSDLDMNEEFGLSIPRAKHLLAVPTYRLHT